MNYKTIHDTITENELNGVLYLLRKFTYYSEIITPYTVTNGEYATYTVTEGENNTLNINITNAKRKNCYYSINNESVFVGDNGTGTINIPSTSNDLEVKLTYMGIIEEEITSDVYTLTLVASSNNVTVGDTVTYTATLLKNNVPMEDEDITFYIDGVYSMGTTNSNGVVTKTYTPSTGGTLSASASYAYTDSDTVNVTVNKYSSSLSLASSSSTIPLGDSVTLSGTLTTHNSGNQSLKIYNGNTLVTTVTTANDGTYSTIITPPSMGTYNLHAEFDGDSSHGACESSVVQVTVTHYTLSLVAWANVPLSEFMTGDQVLFTATLKNNGVPVSGETISFSVGGVTSTDTTDSYGEATAMYTGTGAGDVTVTASYGSLLQETFVLQDCIDVITGETDQTSKFGSSVGLRNNGTGSLSYDSNNKYYKMVCSRVNSESFIPITLATGHDDFSIEFDAYVTENTAVIGITTYHNSNNWLRLSNLGNKKAYYYMNNGTGLEDEENSSAMGNSRWVHYKYTFTNDTITKQIYYNDTLQETVSQSVDSSWFDSNTEYGIVVLWSTSWSNKSYYKNIKVKAL